MDSPRMIISTNPESTSAPLVILAGAQDVPVQQQQPIQQGSSENPSRECIRQPLPQEAHHSSPTSLEEPPEAQGILSVGCAKQLTSEGNQLQTPTIGEEMKTSQMETESVQQCERMEEEMEHTEVQSQTEHQSQMVQPSKRKGSEIGHESEITLEKVRQSKRGEDQIQTSKMVSEKEHHSEEKQNEVRPSSRSERTEHQSQMIQEEVQSSKIGIQTRHQSQVIQDPTQSSKRFLETEHHSEKIQDEVRPSSRGNRAESLLILDPVQPSQGQSKTGHQTQIVQNEILLSEMEVEEIRLSQLAAQDNISSESFERQEIVRENLLPQNEISERTLYQISKDQSQQIGLHQQELHPQQEEPCPQTLLQISDIVHPSDQSNALNVSPHSAQKTDPTHITSTPIRHQKEPNLTIGQQENEQDNQRQTSLLATKTDPLPQGSFIQPWLGFVPRQPSYKLLRSNVLKRSCNIDDKNCQNAEMGVAVKKTDPSIVTHGKNSPKHSAAAEETTAPSQPQSDKGSETLPSSLATSSSLRLSTDLSSISSGSCEIVSPSDSNSAEEFFMGSPQEAMDTSYNFISRHLQQDVKACIIKLYRNQQLDVATGEQIYSIYS